MFTCFEYTFELTMETFSQGVEDVARANLLALEGEWEGFRRVVASLLFSLSAISWLAFILVELRVKEPILPMDLFGKPVFSVSSTVALLTGAGLFDAIMFIPLFPQGVLGLSATSSGMLLTPMMLAVVFS